MGLGFRIINRKQLPSRASHRTAGVLLGFALPCAGCAGSAGNGEWKGSSLDVTNGPDRSVRRCRGVTEVNGPSARQITFPLNLRAQCKQRRKICQAKIEQKTQNVVTRCLMCLPLVVKFQIGTRGKMTACGNHFDFLPSANHNIINGRRRSEPACYAEKLRINSRALRIDERSVPA